MGSGSLRNRIAELYQTMEGADSAHGALSWFAKQANVQRETVSRWVNGQVGLPGPAKALLDALEREVGIGEGR